VFHVSIWGGLEFVWGAKPPTPPWRRDWSWVFLCKYRTSRYPKFY